MTPISGKIPSPPKHISSPENKPITRRYSKDYNNKKCYMSKSTNCSFKNNTPSTVRSTPKLALQTGYALKSTSCWACWEKAASAKSTKPLMLKKCDNQRARSMSSTQTGTALPNKIISSTP
jgi:hypothetical protein